MTPELLGFLRSSTAYFFDLVFILLLTEWRFPRRRTFLIAGVFFTTVSGINLILRLLFPWGYLPLMFFATLSALADVLFAFLVSRHRDGRTAFSALSALLFATIAGTAAYLTAWSVNPELRQLLVNFTLRPLFCLYLYRLRRPLLKLMSEVSTGWLALSLIPGACYAIYITLSWLPAALEKRKENILPVLLLNVTVFLIYSAFCSIYGKLRKQHEMEQEHALMTLQMEALEKRVQAFSEAEEEMKKFHHDMRHFARIATACIQNGELEEVRRIVSKLDEDSGKILSDKLSPAYSSSPALNAVLSYYCERAEKSGIDIAAALDLPPGVTEDGADFSAAEFSVVIANALENAIHACEQIPDPRNRKIRLKGAPAHGQYLITLSNTYAGEVDFHPDTGLPVSHRENHGVGTKSILAFAQKHGAQADFSTESGIFRLKLLF